MSVPIVFTNHIDIGEYNIYVGPPGTDAERKVVSQATMQQFTIIAASEGVLIGNNNWSGTNTFGNLLTVNSGLIVNSTITGQDIYADTIYASNIVNTIGNIGAPTVNATNVSATNI
jgi:hypothetical protein